MEVKGYITLAPGEMSHGRGGGSHLRMSQFEMGQFLVLYHRSEISQFSWHKFIVDKFQKAVTTEPEGAEKICDQFWKAHFMLNRIHILSVKLSKRGGNFGWPYLWNEQS